MTGVPLDAVALRPHVEALGCDWHYLDETGSTNADALEYHARHGREVVVFAEMQHAGRGRRGRSWLSPRARNLYCTVGLSHDLPPASQGLLSIVTGVALCRELRQSTGLDIGLKWPNDLLLDERKLGGILIESRATPDGRFFFAIGFGLNLLMDAEELAALDRPATSLAEALDGDLDRGEVLLPLVQAVVRSIRDFAPSAAAQLASEFAGYDVYHGRPVELDSGGERLRGINRGIADNGELQLEDEQGISRHAAAEISLRSGDR